MLEPLLIDRDTEPGRGRIQVDEAIHGHRLAMETVPEQLVPDLDIHGREELGHGGIEAGHDDVEIVHLAGMGDNGDGMGLGEGRDLAGLGETADAVGIELDVIDGTRLDKIDVSIQSLGTVTGSGTISPDNALDFKLVANLAGAGGDLTKVAGFGSGGIPVSVGGTTSNPTFGPDMKAMATGKLKGLTAGKGNPLGSLGGLFGKKKSSQ